MLVLVLEVRIAFTSLFTAYLPTPSTSTFYVYCLFIIRLVSKQLDVW